MIDTFGEGWKTSRTGILRSLISTLDLSTEVFIGNSFLKCIETARRKFLTLRIIAKLFSHRDSQDLSTYKAILTRMMLP